MSKLKSGSYYLTIPKLVGKTPSDITRWLSGNHNFTILTLSLIEARTGLSIVKKLSKSNIKDHIDGNIFKLQTEKELKLEILKLKKKVKALKKSIDYLDEQFNDIAISD